MSATTLNKSNAGTLRVYIDTHEILLSDVSPQTTLLELVNALQHSLEEFMFKKIPSTITYSFTTGGPSETYPTPMPDLKLDLIYYNIACWINSKDRRDAITLKCIIG